MKEFLPYFYRVWIIRLRVVLAFAMLGIVSFASALRFAIAANCKKPNEFCNPLAVNSFSALVTTIAEAVLKIGVPLAGAAIIFVGVRFVIAAASGNEGAVTKAKTMLWYVLIGTVIIVGGSVLADAIVKFVTEGLGKK